MDGTGIFVGLGCVMMFFYLAMIAVVIALMVLLFKFVYRFFFTEAKKAGTAALAEHSFQQGIAELNRRLAAGEIDEAEYNRLRAIIEQKGPSSPPGS